MNSNILSKMLWLPIYFLGIHIVSGQVASPGQSKDYRIYMDRYVSKKEGFRLLPGLPEKHAYVYPSKNNRKELTIDLAALPDGIYEISSHSILIGTDSGYQFKMDLFFGAQRPTSRIIYDAHSGGNQFTGRFSISGKDKMLELKIPEGVAIGYLDIHPYIAPQPPKQLSTYQPSVVPPVSHPRIWVTSEFLPELKKRVLSDEDSTAWAEVRKLALAPIGSAIPNDKEISFDEKLEYAIQSKAFYFLITGEVKVGEDAVDLLARYLHVLEFGNVTYGDITREIGRSIYTASLVYDWCYALLSQDEKSSIRFHMERLARDMEIGWPPFVDPIVNGHANEAQVSRDLLAMSIAIYNEDTLPYRYVSYALLEQLVPMRQFEYQSPRHNQGVDYGAYRFGWEMHGAMMFYRMLGKKVYEQNLVNLPYYWLYMRLPDGNMLRDGDMFSGKNAGAKDFYWKQPQTMLLCAAYLDDPLMKGEFVREGGLPNDPLLFLLLNDPALKTQKNIAHLPLTKDFGKILGGMIARTGWDNTVESNDVIAEIKGGGYNFGNHQHPDAGALQVYYHGMQLGDIGLYLGYGTPYDFNFNKRSVSHSMMLAYDSSEKVYYRAKTNDGGARFSQRFPVSPQDVVTDPWFNYGDVLSYDQGPSSQHPVYSYFKADLTAAYSEKLKSYARSFCFFNTGNPQVPGIIVLSDEMESAVSGVRQYWQVNTVKKVSINNGGIQLGKEGEVGRTEITTLLPSSSLRQVDVLSGDSSRDVFGTYYALKSDRPEAHGSRVMISYKDIGEQRHRYLNVFQMVHDGGIPYPVDFVDSGRYYIVSLDSFVNVLSSSRQSINSRLSFGVSEKWKLSKVVLNGLGEGFWNVRQVGIAKTQNVYVHPGKNTLYLELGPGVYILNPGRDYNGTYYEVPTGAPYILK